MTAEDPRRPSEQQESVESGSLPGPDRTGTADSEAPAPQFTPPGNDGMGRDTEKDNIADAAGSEKPGDPEERAMRVENE